MSMRGASAGAFCLFAAEQICRHYDGGAWRWSLVFDALGYEAKASERQDWVRTGLMDYWRRPIVHTTSSDRLLGSLICEGGLPLSILADGRERHLRSFFRDVIHDAERLRVPAGEIVERRLDSLPLTLRNSTVIDLSVLLADAIIALRRQLPAKIDRDPQQLLDEVAPGWRLSVPLRLGHPAVGELLRGLLREPRPVGLTDSTVEVKTVLVGPPFRVERQATLPPRCAVDTLAAALGMEAEAMRQHTWVTLSLLASNGERRKIGVARQALDGTCCLLESERDAGIREASAVLDSVRLVASVGWREIARAEPPGGGPLLADAPWVFEGGERPLRFLRRQGALRSSASDVVVLLSPVMRLTGSATIRELGTLGDRRVVSISGHAVVVGGDEPYEIRTDTDDEEEATFVLSGELRRTGFGGSEYWRGMPRIDLVRANGVRMAVPADAFRVRSVGTSTWQPARTRWGALDVRCQHGGASYRTRLIALPPDFAVRLDSSTTSIELCSGELVAAVHEAVRHSASKGLCRIQVPASLDKPTVDVELDFGRGTAKASIPAPVRRAVFVGRDGPSRGPVVLDLLGQVRARATSPNAADRFELRARVVTKAPGLNGKETLGPWLSLVFLPDAGGARGAWELPLDSVSEHLRDLLAISDHLDARVEVRIVAHGAALSPEPELVVRRYEGVAYFVRASEGVEVALDDAALHNLSAQALDLLEFELRPVTAPSMAGPKPARGADGQLRWRVAEAQLADHPTWMLLGRIGERVRLRPVVVPLGPPVQPSEGLEGLLLESNMTRRRDGLRELLRAITDDWQRPEWDTVSVFLKTLRSLPATTFDLVAMLPREPAACAAALVRCTGSDAAVERVWRGLDELPFMWEAMPLSAWRRAAEGFDRWASSVAEKAGIDRRALVSMLLQPIVAHGPRLSPLFGAIHGVFARLVTDCPPATGDMIAAWQQPGRGPVGLLDYRVQELLHRHHDDLPPTNLPVRGAGGRDIDCMVPCGAQLNAAFQAVIRAPYLAGWAAGSDTRLDDGSLLSMRRARTFDPTWFEFAHAMAFTRAAAARLPPRR